MKKNLTIIAMLVLFGIFSSCEKDNLDYAPDASFSGEIRDLETGELVQQDILEGAKIYFIELGGIILRCNRWYSKMTGLFRIILCSRVIIRL